MTTTQIANPHDLTTFDWLAALEAVLADSRHRDKPLRPEAYTQLLEAACDLLVEQIRHQQPVVDAAQAFEATRVGGAAFDREYRALLAAVRTYEEGQS